MWSELRSVPRVLDHLAVWRPARWPHSRRSALQSKSVQDRFDDFGLDNRRDHPHAASTAGAFQDIYLKNAQQKLGPQQLPDRPAPRLCGLVVLEPQQRGFVLPVGLETWIFFRDGNHLRSVPCCRCQNAVIANTMGARARNKSAEPLHEFVERQYEVRSPVRERRFQLQPNMGVIELLQPSNSMCSSAW